MATIIKLTSSTATPMVFDLLPVSSGDMLVMKWVMNGWQMWLCDHLLDRGLINRGSDGIRVG
jgi:hypothetical protein